MAEGLPVGLVQVYTGKGKGKTTAALGLAMRAVGQGLRVAVLQFLKGKSDCGEHLFLKKYPAFEIIQPAAGSYFLTSVERRRGHAQETLKKAKELVTSGEYDLVVLDEALTAAARGFISKEDLLELIRAKPPQVELVLTGRGAPPDVIEAADLVTEMAAVKHPFAKGVPARKGIEF